MKAKNTIVIKTAAVAALIALCSMPAFPANTYYVKPGGDDGDSGLSESSAFATPEKGFASVNADAGSTLVICPGVYSLSRAIGCTGGSSESKRTFVRGKTGNPADVVLDAGGKFECLRLARFIEISGITVSNGVNTVGGCYAGGIRFSVSNNDTYATVVTNCVVACCTNVFDSSGSGGAVALIGHNLMIDSVIRDNTAVANCAGVLVVNNDSTKGVPRLERCRIEGNVASKGGGVYIANNTGKGTLQSDGNAVEIVDCEIFGNVATNGAGVCFATTNMTARLTGCVISNNTASANSGGIRLENGADMVMDSCRVEANCAVIAAGVDVIGNNDSPKTTLTCSNTVLARNNASQTGGGARIYNNAQAFFGDAVFRGNVAVNNGGGACIYGTGDGNFENCRFDGNEATTTEQAEYTGGGGLFVSGQSDTVQAHCSVSNCVFAGNASGTRAGGMGGTWQKCHFNGYIVNCTFTNNSSRLMGGGLLIRDDYTAANPTPPIIRNCLFAFNRTLEGDGKDVDANGAGVYFVTYSGIEIENCTIVSNSVGYTQKNTSGGIHHRYGGKLKNCIVAFNTVGGGLEDGTSWTLKSDAAYDHCCGWPEVARFTAAYGCINLDPKFTDAANSDFTLKLGSRCRNAGVESEWMQGALDLAGNPRIFQTVDIGCYETIVPLGMVISFR